MDKISAGNYDMNVWLAGGYDKGIITTFYGGPGSGKTNFCIIAAVSQAKKGNKVIFIDTEGGFSSERVKQLYLSKSTNGVDEKLSIDQVLSNILVLKPTNFKEQKESFDQLLKYMKEQVSLIVVDGMTMLYRLDFADARKEDNFENINAINATLTKQMRLLVEIARKNNIAILVTNQIYNWKDETRMVAGDIFYKSVQRRERYSRSCGYESVWRERRRCHSRYASQSKDYKLRHTLWYGSKCSTSEYRH
jgi:DNA repair protein RadB